MIFQVSAQKPIQHIQQCMRDAPSAGSLYKIIGGGETAEGLSNWDNLLLFSELFHSWAQKCLGKENDFVKKVASHQEHLKYGIDIDIEQ